MRGALQFPTSDFRFTIFAMVSASFLIPMTDDHSEAAVVALSQRQFSTSRNMLAPIKSSSGFRLLASLIIGHMRAPAIANCQGRNVLLLNDHS
jgi:hypothetical protein